MSSVAFTIGSWPVYWYGILISAALIIGVFLSQHLAKARGYNIDQLWTIFLVTIPAAIIGARLYYVIFNWDLYGADPSLIFKTWKGGLAVHGGLLAGMLAVFLCGRAYKMDVWGVLDCIAPSMSLGQAIGRWGNFFNGEAYGSVTNLPWGIHVSADHYLHHPTFLYESLWDLLLFVILMRMFRRSRRSGNVTLVYLLVYSVGRFFIEWLRMDSLMIGPFRQAQVMSACLFLIALVLLVCRNRRMNRLETAKAQPHAVIAAKKDKPRPNGKATPKQGKPQPRENATKTQARNGKKRKK